MGKINILPVYPKFPPTFWGFNYSLPYIGKKAVMTPTGLATVAAMIPEEQFQVQRIIDLNIEPLTDEQIKNSDLISISSMIIQEDSRNEIIDRAHFHGKKVIDGGPFPTSYPERTSNADYRICGEAEITLKPFLEDLLKGVAKKEYTEEEIIRQGRFQGKLTRERKPELSQTPMPRWDLINLNAYNSIAIQYSRGCPFDCEFCDITKLFGRVPRTKTNEQMLAEIQRIYDLNYNGSIFIVDDNFIGNKVNVDKLLPEIIKWQKEHNHPFSFFTEASMHLAWPNYKKTLEMMVKAGFDEVFLGIESIDKEVLEKMGKKQNVKINPLDAVRIIQNSGLRVSGGFIIGSDGEKPTVFDNIYQFIQDAGIPIAMPGLLGVLKGTKLYERLEKEGRLREGVSGDNTHRFQFNFQPEMDEEFLINGYKELIKKLYTPKNYYKRCITLQENLGKKEHKQKRLNMTGIIAFGKSLIKILPSKGGFQYAKYLGRTLLTNPKYIPEAVTDAIKLKHFNTITEASLEVDEYSTRIKTLYEKFLRKTEEGKDYAEKILKKAERQYQKLHKDFRNRANQTIEDLRNKINSYRK